MVNGYIKAESIKLTKYEYLDFCMIKQQARLARAYEKEIQGVHDIVLGPGLEGPNSSRVM